MADKRKVENEVLRCFKNIDEGVKGFTELFCKFEKAQTPNQKAKYENDLKKDIKKLQRLRDQLKGFCGRYKDENALKKYRRKVEEQMEKFKACEKETKLKAFSIKGLETLQKDSEKDKTHQWIQDKINKLNEKSELYESEIAQHCKGKKRKGRFENQNRINDLQVFIERNNFHVENLEKVLRLLDNESVQVNDLDALQDEIVYYIECGEEDEYFHNENIYEDIVVNADALFAVPEMPEVILEKDEVEENLLEGESASEVKAVDEKQESLAPQFSALPVAHAVVVEKDPVPEESTFFSTSVYPVNNPYIDNESYPPLDSLLSSKQLRFLPLPKSQNLPTTDSLKSRTNLEKSSDVLPKAAGKTSSYDEIPIDQLSLKDKKDPEDAVHISPVEIHCCNGKLTSRNLEDRRLIDQSYEASLDCFHPMSTRNNLNVCPVETPSYYPQFEHPQIAENYPEMAPETLFFIFYYLRGSYAEHLASKALKDLHWRHHRGLDIWFRRKVQPVEMTEFYEVGLYEYYCREDLKCKEKDNFKFEYKYLGR